MGGGDHLRAGIAKQHDAAIGPGDAQSQPTRGGHDRIAMRALRPWSIDAGGLRGMDLIGNEQVLSGHAQRLRHAAFVLRHRFGIVARARAAVEGGVNAFADAALPGEKGMGDSLRFEQAGADCG